MTTVRYSTLRYEGTVWSQGPSFPRCIDGWVWRSNVLAIDGLDELRRYIPLIRWTVGMTGCTKVHANKVALVICWSLSVSLLWPLCNSFGHLFTRYHLRGILGRGGVALWSDSQCFFPHMHPPRSGGGDFVIARSLWSSQVFQKNGQGRKSPGIPSLRC